MAFTMRQILTQLLGSSRLCSNIAKYPGSSTGFHGNRCASSSSHDYAFEMSCSNIRYGEGCTQEVGMDCKNLGGKNVCVMTDKKLVNLAPVKVTIESLERNNVPYKIYDNVRVEPTDESFKAAIKFAEENNFDVFVAVGGGSVIDTCKAANLYSSNPAADFLDYVNAPVGKGLPVTHQVKPLIAVATTAGTGSETTGVAIFDYLPLRAKTGIGSRVIRPTLGIVDPNNVASMPERVTAYSGLDVLCHSLESLTAVPFNQRSPCPEDPKNRPAYQGCNPISDIWSKEALRMTSKYLKRATYNPDDSKARAAMHLASAYAGVGFGNAGVHLCHGMSYPISGLVKNYKSKDYSDDHPLVPHGLSVIITAPAVFNFTAPACPDRHLEAIDLLGGDSRNVKSADAGKVLGDLLRKVMEDVEIPDGLLQLGYGSQDISDLVKGTLPQQRVTKLSPRPALEEDFAKMLEDSMKIY